jgi:hypothetical protein
LVFHYSEDYSEGEYLEFCTEYEQQYGGGRVVAEAVAFVRRKLRRHTRSAAASAAASVRTIAASRVGRAWLVGLFLQLYKNIPT